MYDWDQPGHAGGREGDVQMGAQQSEELIRSGYEAFSKGDMETIAGLFAPDIKWNISGRSSLSGTYSGQDEVFAFFARLVDETGGTFAIDIHDILASDDHVVVLVRESATRGDKSAEVEEAHVWHLDGDKATEFWGIPRDQHHADEFWA